MTCAICVTGDLAKAVLCDNAHIYISVDNGDGFCVACDCHFVYLLSWDDFYKSTGCRESLSAYHDGLTTFDLYAHEDLWIKQREELAT